MKRTVKVILAAAFMACMLAVSAFAANSALVNYSISPVDGYKNAYDIYINIKSDVPVGTFKAKVSFNNEIFLPADPETDYEVLDVSDPDVAAYPIVLIKEKRLAYTMNEKTWTIDGTKTTLETTMFSEDNAKFTYSNLNIAKISFVLAEGKTKADITAKDFTIDMLGIISGEDASVMFTYNDPRYTDNLTFTNNVVPSTTAKITVPAGSSVVFQDYTQAAYEAETEVDVDITTDGFVVVNTGYTAQTVYQVANGSIAKVGNFDDGLLGSANTDIRADSKYQGIRFHSFITDIARTEADDNKIVEYGYVVTAESKKNALPANYELNMSMVDAGKAFKGVAFDAKTNIVFKKNDDNTEFTGLVVGIPMTKDGLNTIIAARPYYKTQSGKYVYGKMTRKTVAETAKAIKAEGGETYNNNKDYIDKILSTVAEDFTEISIDVSELYAE